jgi:hypothetical protein
MEADYTIDIRNHMKDIVERGILKTMTGDIEFLYKHGQ